MKTLSKEIERVQRFIDQSGDSETDRIHIFFWERTIRRLKAMRRDHPYLDHPACFLVEEMERLIRRLQDVVCEEDSIEIETLLQKLKEAK